MTVRQFMLKKFPTNEWMDCPVPQHHWETIQEYANEYSQLISIEFARFIWGEYEESGTPKDMRYFKEDDRPAKYYTTQELFQLYLESKNK